MIVFTQWREERESKVVMNAEEGWREKDLSFDLQRRPRAEKREECERLRHVESYSSLAVCLYVCTYK